MRSFVNWWQFMPGASWMHPEGPGSSLEGRDNYPVVHIAFEDARAYAKWKGHALPTEEQFEYAAQGAGRKNAAGGWAANTWQGTFPLRDSAADGHAGLAPVACFEANRLGLYDVIGNVWEWTRSPYFDRHDSTEANVHPGGFDPVQPDERDVAVLKGGSYLCSPDYCMRYRPEARIGQSTGLGTAHIGFRTLGGSRPAAARGAAKFTTTKRTFARGPSCGVLGLAYAGQFGHTGQIVRWTRSWRILTILRIVRRLGVDNDVCNRDQQGTDDDSERCTGSCKPQAR
jgi:hypothetical protein